MPSASGFRRGFAVSVGDDIAGTGFRVTHSRVDHVAKKTRGKSGSIVTNVGLINAYFLFVWDRYEYPIRLGLEADESIAGSAKARKAFLDSLKKHAAERIVYSGYGSPYDCSFGSPKIESWKMVDGDGEKEKGTQVVVTSKGTATRRRDIPTQREQSLSHESSKQKESSDRAKRAAEKRGYRVIRSHFATSRCPSCARGIEVGEWIAKKEGEGRTRRGGWVHLGCADA